MNRQDFHEKFGTKLSPLKKISKLKNRGFMTFDAETKDGLKGKQLFCWSLAYKTDTSNEVMSGLDDLKPLFEKIKCNDERKSMSRIVYVHNLGFDCRFLINYCALNKIDYDVCQSGGNVIQMYIPSLHVKFIDSFQFLFSSQEKAEIEWNVNENLRKIDCSKIFNKHFRKWTKENKERVINHNKNDTLALLEIMSKFREVVFEISGLDCLNCISLANMALKALRKELTSPIENPFVYRVLNKKTKRITYKYEKKEDAFCRKGYFGGRTEVFNQKLLQDIVVLDKVSMYPTQMKLKTYPCGYGKWIRDKDILMDIIKGIDNREGVINCYIKPLKELKFPVFPKRLDKKIMFTNCYLRGNYSIPELRYAYSLKDAYEIIPNVGLIFDSHVSYFANFVDKYFAIKQKQKGGKRQFAKIMLNASYGKFGQAFERKAPKFHYNFSKEDEIDKMRELEDNNKNVVKTVKNPNEPFSITIESIDSTVIKQYQNVVIALYITAYSRIDLLQQMHNFESKNIDLYYSDSDSIFIDKMNLSKIQLGKDLGCWDLDKEFKQLKILAPKCYFGQYIDGKYFIKMKGIPKSKIDEILESSHSMSEIEEQLREPIRMAEKYLCYNEAHRTGVILGTKELSKVYSFENNKRFFQNGLSIAWNDKNIPEKLRKELFV